MPQTPSSPTIPINRAKSTKHHGQLVVSHERHPVVVSEYDLYSAPTELQVMEVLADSHYDSRPTQSLKAAEHAGQECDLFLHPRRL